MLNSKMEFVISIIVTLVVITIGGMLASSLGEEVAQIDSGAETTLSITSGKHYIIMVPINADGDVTLDSNLGFQACKDSTYDCSYFELGGYEYQGMIERPSDSSLKINSTYNEPVLIFEKSGLVYNFVGFTGLTFILATVIIGLRFKKKNELDEARRTEENAARQREHELQMIAMSSNNASNVRPSYQPQNQPMTQGVLHPGVQLMAQEYMALHNSGIISSSQTETKPLKANNQKKKPGIGRRIGGATVKGAIGLLATRPDPINKFKCTKCRQIKTTEGPGPIPKCCGKLMHRKFN